MFKSIATKVWAITTLLVLSILLIFSFILGFRLENIYHKYQIGLMLDHAQQWREVLLSGLSEKRIQEEMEFWGRVSHYNITVLDQNGIIRFASNKKHSPLGKKTNWPYFRGESAGKAASYTGFSREFNMDMTATFLPVQQENGSQSTIMIHAPTTDLMEMIRVTRSSGLTLLVVLFILSGALIWYLSRIITRPVAKIRRIALDMAKGNFSTLADTTRQDELGDLARAMNILSVRLNSTLGSLSRANSELTQLLKQWKEFVADVSHELRTPLFLIQGYTEAIFDNVVTDEKTKTEYLGVINKESKRLQKLVNDLLALESGLPLHKTPTDLGELIRETRVPFEIRLKDKNLTLKIDEKLKKLKPIEIDRDKIAEIFYNLIDNAIRHSQPNGTIAISVKQAALDKLQVIISDSGAGIPAEHLPRLFDRFYRVDQSRSRAGGGTGLGLAIVKNIIEQHGGDIQVSSEVGRGTAFIITLPQESKETGA